VANGGDAATASRFFVELYLDGVLWSTWFTDPPLNPNFYVFVENFPIGSLPSGIHTLRIKSDSTGVIAESNEADNEYTKTIVVSVVSGSPNLTPLQPTGWSDRIVVATTPGTKIDSALSTADTLYVSWAVWNNGTGATQARFYTELYLDGVLRGSWFSDPPLNPGFVAYVEDFSIGSLSAGTHTLRIKTDSTGAIAESIETDNEYTKTIAVSAPPPSCSAGPTTLCLNNGRFKVQVAWRVPAQGTSGPGNAVTLTGDTGYLWFFSANNIELVVKVVDGRGFNGKFWVFYGALSNVEYTISVTDTVTGSVRTYFNPNGQLASVADTAAF
jgi:hypothetical protein